MDDYGRRLRITSKDSLNRFPFSSPLSLSEITWSAVAESEASLRAQDVDTAFASDWASSARRGKAVSPARASPLPPHSKWGAREDVRLERGRCPRLVYVAPPGFFGTPTSVVNRNRARRGERERRRERITSKDSLNPPAATMSQTLRAGRFPFSSPLSFTGKAGR